MTTEVKEFLRREFDAALGLIAWLALVAILAVFTAYLFGLTWAIGEIGYRHALSLFAS